MTAPDDVGGDRADLGTFAFERGGQLPLTVAYETYGEYDGTNAVLLCHALTGSHAVVSNDEADQAVGWWNDVVGPGRPIDTDRYFVISMNVPGSCYGTTGPADVDPSTGERYGSEYPPVTVRDWTHAQRRLVEHLGVDRLRAVVGGSVGGMNALDWVVAYPALVDRVVAIATGARLDAQLVALSTIGRRAITTDPAWQGGDYYPDHPDEGLAVARRLALVTYRSKRSMARQFGREVADHTDPFPYREVASYLDYNADRFVDRFDANSYVRLSRAMEAYDLARNHESDAAAVADFDGEALIVSVTTDWHFTVDQSRSLADAFRDAAVPAHHEVVDSAYGHDAFLVEPERYASGLAAFLDGTDDLGTVRGRRRGEG